MPVLEDLLRSGLEGLREVLGALRRLGVGLGGLGHQIQISLLDLDYQRAWTFIFVLIGLVILVDVWSSVVRQRTAS